LNCARPPGTIVSAAVIRSNEDGLTVHIQGKSTTAGAIFFTRRGIASPLEPKKKHTRHAALDTAKAPHAGATEERTTFIRFKKIGPKVSRSSLNCQQGVSKHRTARHKNQPYFLTRALCGFALDYLSSMLWARLWPMTTESRRATLILLGHTRGKSVLR
jgi:hypothetical protein